MVKAGGVALLAVLAWTPAWAWTGSVIWPTYTYEGPNTAYKVLDELARGQQLDVLSCDGDWCRVTYERSTAYVDRASILPAGQAAARTQPIPELCFDARSDGYQKGELWRYCPEKAPGG